MLVIYMVTSFMIWTGFRLISGVIDKVKLEAFDKQLGAMFGFAKGVLLCVAVTFFAVTLLPPTQGEMIVGSQSGQYIAQFLSKADAVMPPEIHQVVDPYLHRVQQRLNPGFQANFPGAMRRNNRCRRSRPAGRFPAWRRRISRNAERAAAEDRMAAVGARRSAAGLALADAKLCTEHFYVWSTAGTEPVPRSLFGRSADERYLLIGGFQPHSWRRVARF